MGLCADYIGPINSGVLWTFLSALACFVVWTFAKSFGVLIFFAIFIGMICGAFWMLCQSVVYEVLDLKDLGSGLTLLWLVMVVPTTFAEPIALSMRKSGRDGYLPPILFAGATYIAGGLFCVGLKAWTQRKARGKEQTWKIVVRT